MRASDASRFRTNGAYPRVARVNISKGMKRRAVISGISTVARPAASAVAQTSYVRCSWLGGALTIVAPAMEQHADVVDAPGLVVPALPTRAAGPERDRHAVAPV